ncbi:MAG: carboxypeptidase regulatory-like domain-containing protein, partial [Trueperella pyogenes]|nr:carboxypeptidase regulatory-like domain-containing protein [Trueperella pyogenes]
DIYDINANGSVTDKVCPVTSGMSVNELAAAGVVLESLGSVPGSVYMKYNDGTSLIRQGENGTFRITPTNTGNANLSDMTVYGTLPHVGDTAVRTSASRGSEWAPIMTGPIQVQPGDGIDPSQVTIEYSTSYNPCRGEVMERGKSKADAPAGCDNNWTSNPSSWSDVKSYRIYINGKTNPIEGGASIPLIVPIKAPDNANGVAYESVAVAATQASSNQAVFPSEPFKVAIASAFDVALNKTVSSDASALSPGDEVTFRVDAANTGQGLSANTKVSEKLPDGVTFVKSESFMCPTGYVSGTPDACEAGDPAGTYDAATGVWTIGDLTAGSHASLYVTVRLNDGTDGKSITNNVEFKDLPPYDVNLNNNKASTTITVKHRLSGKVYFDKNDSSSYTAGEEGFNGVTVNLVNEAGAVVATTTTDADGNYSFTGLNAGTYTVKVVKDGELANLTQTEDPDGTKDNASGAITLNTDNPVRENVNFGYVKKHAISGNIYLDENRDKTKNGDDINLSGVTVTLVDGSGNVVATTTTDASGNYNFPGLSDGTYTVKVDTTGKLAGLEQTEDPSGAKNSQSMPITFTRNDPDVTNVNFGYAKDYSIAGNVYRDSNRSESKDATETVFQGVTVNLVDASGNVVATTTTDANGNYSFSKLPAGDYTVKVVKDGAIKDMDQTEDPDGKKDNASGKISIGADNPTQTGVNFGYVPDYSISGTIFRDEARNGVKDPSDPRFPSVKVTLLDENGNVVETTTTDSNGAYKFSHLPDGKYRVKVDTTGVLNGLEVTLDPDTLKDSQSELIELGESNPTVENVDFGYMEKEIPAAPQPPKQPNPKTPGSKLARTGVEAGVLSVGLAALVAGGALLALRRRGRIS